MKKPRIGIILPGHAPRLLAHFGFTQKYMEFSGEYSQLRPYLIIGVSAGSFPATVATPWDRDMFERATKKVLILRMRDFGHINRELESWAGVGAGGTGLLFVPFEKIENKTGRFLAKAIAAAAVLGVEVKAIDRLFHVESVFSNTPLERLVRKMLGPQGFRAIFESSIKLEILVANINGDKAHDTRVKSKIITNYLPEHQSPEKLMWGLRKSSSVPAFFEPGHDSEGTYSDGATFSNMPVHFALRHNCDVVIVLHYDYEGYGWTDRDFGSWISITQRSFDIGVDKHSDSVISGYLRINKDLKVLDRQRRSVDSLEALMPRVESSVPQELALAYRGSVDLLRRTLEDFSFSHRKEINLIIVKSRRKIPVQDFRRFTDSKNAHIHGIGQEACIDVLPEILEQIKKVAEAK